MGRRKKGKHGTYQVAVTIIEAKYLAQNSNPMVMVKVGHQKKKTIIRNRTDSPYYNEYFIFNYTGDFDTFLHTRISISVYLKRCLRLKFHGGIFFDVSTVWDQPDHEYYHKWALLTNPKDPAGGPKGYVKCNIGINAKGVTIPTHLETDKEEDIEGNLLMPIANFLATGRQKAHYIFTVFRADGLPCKNTSHCCVDSDNIVNPFIQISFAGMKGETSWHSETYTPRFNEKIIFTEMFPPLSYRARIAIKDKVNSCRSKTLATFTLNLAELSNSGEHGFLPTYGPSFIHFHDGTNEGSEYSCVTKCQNTRPIYQGRVLLSLKTEIDDSEAPLFPGVEAEPTAPIIEHKLWSTEEYLLVGVVYAADMIDRSRFLRKPISFEMNLGNVGSNVFSYDMETYDRLSNQVILDKRPDFVSSTAPRLTASTDGKFNYLPLGSNKPCMYVKSWWPNLEWRVSNTNSLSYIADFLEDMLSELETLIAVENATAYETYNTVIESLKRYCMHYLSILDTDIYTENGGTTKLDRHRINLCHYCIQDIITMINVNGKLPNNNYIKIAMLHAYKYLTSIRQVSEDPQHAFPDVFIWMIAGSKHVAVARLPAARIIFVEDEMSRGRKCGRRINLFMKSITDGFVDDAVDYSACNIEIFLWFGNAKFASACWSAIPHGYDVEHSVNMELFPKSLNYTTTAKFQLRAHIFQGRFDSGLDATGLMDPFIRIIFHGYTATTRTIKQSLAPVWDETLVFPGIDLYGMRESIKSMPPQVIIEAFDWDFCGPKEFFGRCIAAPVVKFKEETYSPPEFPPTLIWYKLETQSDFQGSILAAFELIEVGADTDILLTPSTESIVYNLPHDIRPVMISHRLEVIFWGIRDMKKINFTRVNKPRVVVECAGIQIKSEIMKSAKKFSNFRHTHAIIELDLPEKDIYYPPITIQVYDTRQFGCAKYAGVCIIPTAHIFLQKLIPDTEYRYKIYDHDDVEESYMRKPISNLILPLPIGYDIEKEEAKNLISTKELKSKPGFNHRMKQFWAIIRNFFCSGKDQTEPEEENYEADEDENYDWWSKYFASLEEERSRELGENKILLPGQKPIATFRIYPMELEMQPEFQRFQEKLTVFELSRGKDTGCSERDKKNISGKFKGHISIYPWSFLDKNKYKTTSGRDVSYGFLSDYPPQEPVKLIVRLYVIRGINLHPCDPLTGKSDPYLIMKLGKNVISDQKNYIPNHLNPIFGKCFEMEAEFPRDHTLIIQVWDWDAMSADDLIGETQIDIENRYYSDHRGCCGISRTYSTSGYNAWRDREKPSQILESLCKRNNLPSPEFSNSCVTIGKQEFPFHATLDTAEKQELRERMALNVLHHWEHFPICGLALVPEHVERRPLFNAERPGLEQGKLELWVDMFRIDDLPPKPAINITPQTPEEYELRVVIWNTEDVPLVDNQFLTGEKCSDIYVKGWIMYEDLQKTDVHYNSLNGEGNFNWRFIFRFLYSKSEHLMIVKKKMSIFSRDETEQKLPCKFSVQVWDSDHFSPDDFLDVPSKVDNSSSLTMDLSRMPRGSANSKNCTLNVTDPKSPTVSLFKVKRIKAWWPFSFVTPQGQTIQAGKVEMEMTLVPIAEAEEKPVGKGRDPPNPLPEPDRPDTSFSWFRNPWKAFCFVVCRYYKWRMICCCSMLLFVLLFCCAIYAFPGYLVKKVLGA